MWFDKLWQNTVDLFRSLDIPVRTLECCSGDLADLKVKSVDVEAWSPRQKKYFDGDLLSVITATDFLTACTLLSTYKKGGTVSCKKKDVLN